jgi:hypothetical protein
LDVSARNGICAFFNAVRPRRVSSTARSAPLSSRTKPSMIASSQTESRGQVLRHASIV